MNRKTKKIVTIMSICLIVLIIVAIILGMRSKEELPDVKNEEVTDMTQNIGIDQSELEVIEEEPADSENVIVEKAEANYERWLAAGMIVGISLHYPEYEFTGIYLASDSEMGNSVDSNGVYIVFECEGEEIAIHSKPLKEERTESGTRDLYTKDLGFATFNEIDAGNIKVEDCEPVSMEELTELIGQSMLVSIYEH